MVSNACIQCLHMNSAESFPRSILYVHEWEGGRCDFHPLRVCTCQKCSNQEEIKCEGKPYQTRMKLDCEFHTLLYEIECMERASQASKLVLKRGHSNAVEASHNVDFGPKISH